MHNTILIYFEGCLNAKAAKEALRALGVEFDSIVQDNIPKDSPYQSYTSPTILKDNQIILGRRTDGKGGGCSMDRLIIDDLRGKLAA